MKKVQITLIGTLVILTITLGNLKGQNLQSSLFDEVNRAMMMAKDAQADVLSPRAYGEAMDAYNAAKKEFADNGGLANIKEKIAKANTNFNAATQNTKVSSVMFSSALSARKDAMNAEAEQFVKELWKDAEKEMKDAGEKLEKGDSNKAKEIAVKATTLYRKAELESIKANYLTNTKLILEKADDNKVYKVAPKTIADSKSLVQKAEKELAENRYDTDEARHLAKQAEYKARLAMQIAKEAEVLDKEKYKTEDYLLMCYAPLIKIGESYNFDVQFDKGIDAPVSMIIERIEKDKLLISNLESTVISQRMTNENMSSMVREQKRIIAEMQGTLSEEAMKAQSRIDRLEDINNKFEQVQQTFNNEEAQVFRQKDDVIIRLIGVNFDVGKSEIKQEDYALLSKVREAMNLFSNSTVVIEGHTDSQGGDDVNLKLSQDRADAMLSYLNANTTMDKDRFSTVGFGESKPVANNESVAGRKINRRIDIVIRPNFTEE